MWSRFAFELDDHSADRNTQVLSRLAWTIREINRHTFDSTLQLPEAVLAAIRAANKEN